MDRFYKKVKTPCAGCKKHIMLLYPYILSFCIMIKATLIDSQGNILAEQNIETNNKKDLYFAKSEMFEQYVWKIQNNILDKVWSSDPEYNDNLKKLINKEQQKKLWFVCYKWDNIVMKSLFWHIDEIDFFESEDLE